MKTTQSRPICLGMMMLFCTFLLPQQTFPQITDSLSQASSGSLQFQLLGGLGIYYLSDCSSTTYFRVGIDGYFNHSDNSGDGTGYSTYSSTSGTTNSYTITTQPEENSTSYEVSVSGVYALRIVEYANTNLYCGAGPIASYSHSKSSTTSSSTSTDDTGTTMESQTNNNTGKTWGVGPLAILGLRNRLLDHVSLSAEISVSALYQWTSRTYNSRYTSTSSPAITSASNYGNTSSSKGWYISLSNIRIGVIVDL
jgi:hypothetical protein